MYEKKNLFSNLIKHDYYQYFSFFYQIQDSFGTEQPGSIHFYILARPNANSQV
jgi:hypothetical protein